MEFCWDEFTEEDFMKYKFDMQNGKLVADDWVGNVRIGELCCDLVLREYTEGELTLTYDVYVGGVDSGYGYSTREAMATGKYKDKYEVPDEEQYPYDYADGGDFDDSCVSLSYTHLKKMAEAKIADFIRLNNLQEKANAPLHKW